MGCGDVVPNDIDYIILATGERAWQGKGKGTDRAQKGRTGERRVR